jgi:hypothetical protein
VCGSRLRYCEECQIGFEVTHHLSTSQRKQFCTSVLAEDELAAAALHTANCQPCEQEFVEELSRNYGFGPVNFTLEPEFWFRNDHLDFDRLVGLADNTLDDDLREITEIHLKVCDTCREDVRSFFASRQATAGDIKVSYGPTKSQSTHVVPPTIWWQRLQITPVYAVAAVLLVAVTFLILFIAMNRRSGALEAGRNDQRNINIDAGPISSPSTSPNVVSSPSIADDSAIVAIVRDAGGEVKIDKNGQVTGLDELSDTSRQQIARAALSERIEPAAVLRDLSGDESGLRGNGDTEKELTLLYPARRVVIEDRPVFKWASLSNATHYRVYVVDANGNQVSQSEELPPTQTQWRAQSALRRGQIFSWTVTALVDGQEIVSPSASDPEMKFAVLSTNDVQELSRLKKQNSHLALGVFYARTGLTNDAERAFESLVKLNPHSELARKLLESVRSTRKGR